jgi:hypothetical protein
VKPLLEMAGPLAVVGELAKLQTTAALLMDDQGRRQVIDDLEESLRDLRADLDRERKYSDPSSRRIMDREQAIDATRRAITSISEDSYRHADDFYAKFERGTKAAGHSLRKAKDWWRDDEDVHASIERGTKATADSCARPGTGGATYSFRAAENAWRCALVWPGLDA